MKTKIGPDSLRQHQDATPSAMTGATINICRQPKTRREKCATTNAGNDDPSFHFSLKIHNA